MLVGYGLNGVRIQALVLCLMVGATVIVGCSGAEDDGDETQDAGVDMGSEDVSAFPQYEKCGDFFWGYETDNSYDFPFEPLMMEATEVPVPGSSVLHFAAGEQYVNYHLDFLDTVPGISVGADYEVEALGGGVCLNMGGEGPTPLGELTVADDAGELFKLIPMSSDSLDYGDRVGEPCVTTNYEGSERLLHPIKLLFAVDGEVHEMNAGETVTIDGNTYWALTALEQEVPGFHGDGSQGGCGLVVMARGADVSF